MVALREREGDVLGRLRDLDDPLDERRSLAAVEKGLFGHAREPVKVGRYVLERPIGSGGVGVVYAAHDPDLDRRVAIKLIEVAVLGFTGPQARALLLREGQAMARISHPCVVEVYDLGVGDRGASAYVVMELITGTDARRWLAEGTAALEDVLHVFGEAGRGLAAAHAAGIAHRDFKPSNVLLERGKAGEVSRVLVSDFGLAGLGIERRTERPHDPAADHGTPRYMAPEHHRGQLPDARSDQYSFCLALWEAAAGESPFAAPTAAELRAAKARGALGRWPPSLPMWLYRIVRRGLEPEPRRRFRSMNALVRALRAGASRRRSVALATGVGAAALLGLAGAGVASDDARCKHAAVELAGVMTPALRSDIRRALADDTSVDGVLRQLDAHAEAWATEHNAACSAVAQGPDALRALDIRRACLDRSLAELQLTVSGIAAGDVAAATALDAAQRLRAPTTCTRPATGVRAGEDPLERVELRALEDALVAARVAYRLGHYSDAKIAAVRAADQAYAAGHGDVVARALAVATDAAINVRGAEDAEELGTRAYTEAVAADDHRTAAEVAIRLVGIVGARRARHGDARAWAEHARARIDRLERATALEASVLSVIGRVDIQAGRSDGLAALQRAAQLTAAMPNVAPRRVARTEWDLGYGFAVEGRFDEALAHHRRALQILEPVLGDEHPKIGQAHGNIGMTLMALGKHDEARVQLLRARSIAVASLGETSVGFVEAESALATLAERRGDFALAVQRRESLLPTLAAVRGEDHPSLGSMHAGIAVALAELGRDDEANVAVERARLGLASLPATHPSRAHFAIAEARVLLLGGALRDAETRARQGYVMLRDRFGPAHRAVGPARLALAATALAEARPEAARAMLEPVLRGPADPLDRAEAAALMSRAAWDTDPQRARELASIAVNAFEMLRAPSKAEVVRQWVRHPRVRTL